MAADEKDMGEGAAARDHPTGLGPKIFFPALSGIRCDRRPEAIQRQAVSVDCLGEGFMRAIRADLVGILIDDHELFVSGLKFLLTDAFPQAQLTVHKDPKSAETGIAAKAGAIDLIVTDYFMPGFAAEIFLPKLRRAAPRASIVCVSATLSPEDGRDARRYGADAFVGKHAPPETLIGVIKSALRGEAEAPAGDPGPAPVNFQAVGLTQRQGEIVLLATEGRSNREIAEQLGLSPETIKAHLAAVYRACEVSNRLELAAWARRQGLLVDH